MWNSLQIIVAFTMVGIALIFVVYVLVRVISRAWYTSKSEVWIENFKTLWKKESEKPHEHEG